MSRSANFIFLIILFGVLPGATLAQSVDTNHNSGLKRSLIGLDKNKFVVVRSLDSEKTVGRIEFIRNDSLCLSRRNKVTAISLSEVEAVWTRSSGTLTGAIVGGGIGLVTGTAIGMAFRRDFGIFEPGEVHNERIFIGLASGAILGTVFGAAIGSIFTTHELQYERAAALALEAPDVTRDTATNRVHFCVSPDLNGGVSVGASLSF